MRRYDLWMSIIWFILSAVICYHAVELRLGSVRSFGPGFIFFWTGVALGLLSIILFIRALMEKGEDRSVKDSRVFANANWPKKIAAILSLTFYAAAYEKLGFLVSTFLLVAFLLYSIEAKKWYVVVGVASVTSVVIYIFFVILLQTRLPRGILWI
jgi:putative tricarboxylic transport membrane protein